MCSRDLWLLNVKTKVVPKWFQQWGHTKTRKKKGIMWIKAVQSIELLSKWHIGQVQYPNLIGCKMCDKHCCRDVLAYKSSSPVRRKHVCLVQTQINVTSLSASNHDVLLYFYHIVSSECDYFNSEVTLRHTLRVQVWIWPLFLDVRNGQNVLLKCVGVSVWYLTPNLLCTLRNLECIPYSLVINK